MFDDCFFRFVSHIQRRRVSFALKRCLRWVHARQLSKLPPRPFSHDSRERKRFTLTLAGTSIFKNKAVSKSKASFPQRDFRPEKEFNALGRCYANKVHDSSLPFATKADLLLHNPYRTPISPNPTVLPMELRQQAMGVGSATIHLSRTRIEPSHPIVELKSFSLLIRPGIRFSESLRRDQ